MCCINKGRATRHEFNGKRCWREWKLDVRTGRLFATTRDYQWSNVEIARLGWDLRGKSKAGLYAHPSRTASAWLDATGYIFLFGKGYQEGNSAFAEVAVIDFVAIKRASLGNIDMESFRAKLQANYPGVPFRFI